MPTTPATPAPPNFPVMTGGWGGQLADTRISPAPIAGFPPTVAGASCVVAWLITAQGAGTFSGTYQHSPGSSGCADTGAINGAVNQDGAIRMTPTSSIPGTCTLTGGSPEYVGVLSGGSLTVQRQYSMRCPFPVIGAIDYSVTDTLSMARR